MMLIDQEKLMRETEEALMSQARLSLREATPQQLHNALSAALMAQISKDWMLSEKRRERGRQVYYLSAEYLMGRMIFNNLYCVRVLEDVEKLLAEKGASLRAMEDVEDAALGNGGLGRLAACYLDSAATHVFPLTGYGLRYRYGLFKQTFADCDQAEAPDDWTHWGDPWGVRRVELAVTVTFRDQIVRAVPYDVPVLGYNTENVGTLRLWQAESEHPLDFELFNEQRYAEACADKNRAEDITKLLYPNDSTDEGKMLRIKQQYVLASASVQDILRGYEAGGGDLRELPEMACAQLNDTHPVMAIPETVRLLTEKGLTFDEAFDTAHRMFNYTNHTVMREALEVWDVALMRRLLPDLTRVIERIDEKLRAEQEGLSVIRDGGIHMADLAVYASNRVNGVAKIHSELLKTDVFPEWYARYPEKFKNVTNGVTQRRWLGLCNPELTQMISERINDNFLIELSELNLLRSRIDERMVARFIAVKQEKKRQLAEYVRAHEGIDLPEHFLFDVQVKRLHEYKRQLMNAFSILAIYFEIKEGRLPDFTPTAFLFGAKAAPGYVRAKSIIRYINKIAQTVNEDDAVADKLRVVFVSNYNCSYAERIIPAADISEQISPAGTEASGTGNMKLMLNGAVTLGTLDGANIEIVEQAGAENNYIFGARVEELKAIKNSYDPKALLRKDKLLARVLNTLIDGTFGTDEGFRELYGALTVGASYHGPDHYFVLKDFGPYLQAKLTANRDYKDREAFARKALYNIAGAGAFSSDRSVEEYAAEIWDM